MPPASSGEEPQLFEVLGSDVFEYENENEKKKYWGILWRDRASGLTMFDMVHTDAVGRKWSPSSEDIIKSLSKWLMYHPAPTWMVTDPATYYTSLEFMDYLGKSGIGLTCVPAEAHWLMGSEEQAIGVAKRTVDKMFRENGKLDIPTLFQLAAHAMNSHVGSTGFSAYQWVYGKDSFNGENLPLGLDPSKAFGGLLKVRDKVKIEFERIKASEKFSKLANAVGRPTVKYHTGQLVMVWRQKVKPGKMKGNWIGPVRVVMIEGSTLWLASGASLIRAKQNQVRPVTKREQLQASLEGTAIFKTPVTTEALLRSFQGRHYLDVSGDVPSERRMQEDLAQTEVQLPPAQERPKADVWVFREIEGLKHLVRIHHLPRLALFSPARLTSCPVSLDELTGKRVTIVNPSLGGDQARIVDDITVVKSLAERWTGETQFEMKLSQRPAKVRRSVPKAGTKRKPETDTADLQEQAQDESLHPEVPAGGSSSSLHPGLPHRELQSELLHPEPQHGQPLSPDLPGRDDGDEIAGNAIPQGSLNEALLRLGSDVVDGVPQTPQIRGASGSNECPTPGCDLPGGHEGAHHGPDGTFLYDQQNDKKMIVDENEAGGASPSSTSTSSSSSSSSSSDELVPDNLYVKKRKRLSKGPVEKRAGARRRAPKTSDPKEVVFYAKELDINEEDFAWLAKNSSKRKAQVWLSKKMSEKGKEVSWDELTLEQKKDFDMAQAKELSQVAQSQALRNLTKAELKSLNPRSIMERRWKQQS